MSVPLFEGIHYYIQSRGIDPDLLQDFRTNLNLNGAISCDNPCDSHCQLIFVETPTGETKFIYNDCGKPDNYKEKKHTGDWDFDTLCTHFSRRGTGIPDVHKERRKKVVGVGWIMECLSQQKLLAENRYGLWEVIAEDSKPREVPTGRPLIPGQNAPSPPSRPTCDKQPAHRGGQQLGSDPRSTRPIDLHINKTPSLAAQEMTPTPNFLNSTPTPIDWGKMPPSPPLTAASTMSTAVMDHWSIPKFFSPFTQDVIGPRTFFVACQNSRELEVSITIHGGMLDTQGEATFIIIDAPLYGCAVPQATLDLLGNLRRSQKAVSPLWIDRCVQHGTIVSLERYIARTSPIVPPTLRQSAGGVGAPPVNTQVPHKKVENPSDVVISYKQASFTLEDTVTLDRKRRLSQSDVHLEDDVVRATGIIRKAVDPRVRPRPSAERQASNPEFSTRPATSISRPIPTTHSSNTFGQKRRLSRFSIYDRPDATTLDLPLTRTGPTPIKDDLYQVANCSDQVPFRGGNMISHPVRSIKASIPNAAVTRSPSLQTTRAYRPDTPPLPSKRSTSPEDLPSHDITRKSVDRPDNIIRRTGSSGLSTSSAKVNLDTDRRQRLASAIHPSRSTMTTSPSETSAHDGHIYAASSTSFFESSDYVPSSDDEATSHTRLGGPSASSGTSAVVQSMRILSPDSQARLGELIDYLDEWLNTEPTNARSQFLRTLDVQKPGYCWGNYYYRMRQTIRSRLLARGHSAMTLDERRIHDAPDTCRLYEATDIVALNRNGHYHPGMAGCERRLKRLITHLEKWLQDGFQSTRSTAIEDLKAILPEVNWTRLYCDKALTIRTRLLAMGWLEVVLNEADIIGKSDRVRGPR